PAARPAPPSCPTRRSSDLTAHNESGYFFTFEMPAREPINQLYLQFKEKNFDWKIRLEGSHDQQEWFTIADDYRIVSISNQLTDRSEEHTSELQSRENLVCR